MVVTGELLTINGKEARALSMKKITYPSRYPYLGDATKTNNNTDGNIIPHNQFEPYWISSSTFYLRANVVHGSNLTMLYHDGSARHSQPSSFAADWKSINPGFTYAYYARGPVALTAN
ncbi:hypothetical protein SDC9_190893 [bioreactor metagenome]|uniref:Uncharacterized protein n=1 Tax=bioreactor metagenome TaxID=1076179 RepID=A0A645I4I8_9ZZZZ